MEAKQIARQDLNDGDMVGIRNMRRYSLFGDPLQRLALPRYQIELEIDKPLSALGVVEVSGAVLDENGELAEEYNGHAWLQAFDSGEVSLLDGLRYRQVGAYIFRGKYEVVKGRFSGQFRVPPKISAMGALRDVSALMLGVTKPLRHAVRWKTYSLPARLLTLSPIQKDRGFALDLRGLRNSAAEIASLVSRR